MITKLIFGLIATSALVSASANTSHADLVETHWADPDCLALCELNRADCMTYQVPRVCGQQNLACRLACEE